MATLDTCRITVTFDRPWGRFACGARGMKKLLIVAAAMVVVSGVGIVMARDAAMAARQPQGMEACTSAKARAGVRNALLTRIAARGGEADAGYALSLDTPRLESIDYTAERTVCGGVARLSVPEHRRAALDGVSELSDPIRYMIEPSADGSGTVVALVGGGDVIAGWLGGPPPPPAPPVLIQTDYGPAEEPVEVEPEAEPKPEPAAQPAVVRTQAPTPTPRPAATPRPAPVARPAPVRVVAANPAPAPGPVIRETPPAPRRSTATASLNRMPTAPTAGSETRRLNAATASARPSFDCRQARNGAERTICGDPALASLDVQMAGRYARMQNSADTRSAEALRDEQRAWLRRRDACETSTCLRSMYEHRAATMGRGT